MIERPSDGLGDNLSARPDVTVFDAVARTPNRRFPLGFVLDTYPLVGTVGAEMDRCVRDRASVVWNIPGVLVGTVSSTERALVVVGKDVLGDGLGQREKNSLCQSSVLHFCFPDKRPNRPSIFGVVNVSERADGRVVRVTLFSLAL